MLSSRDKIALMRQFNSMKILILFVRKVFKVDIGKASIGISIPSWYQNKNGVN